MQAEPPATDATSEANTRRWVQSDPATG